VHIKSRDLSKQVYDVLLPACERFRDAARKWANEIDQRERAEHTMAYDDALPFSPSPLLRAVIFMGLQHWSTPIRNYRLCNLCTPPSNPNNLLELWFNKPQAKPVLPFRPQRRDVSGEARENELAERAKCRDEANKLVESIKIQSAQAIESKKDFIAERAVEFELRKSKVMEKLSNQTGGQENA